MTVEEAMEEIREHGILIDFRPKKGREAIRVIFAALEDYQRMRAQKEAEDNVD